MALLTADANPDKSFFVDSITKDITLLDCVLDLIDNAIDSATSHLKPADILNTPNALKGSKIEIHFNKDHFSIRDNGKGITLEEAQNVVFRFGAIKKPHSQSIGYYGIGLKRATFKMGKNILVVSQSPREEFSVIIEIDKWTQSQEWNFPIDVRTQNGSFDTTSVDVLVDDLYPEISDTFASPVFTTKLNETIGRDYYFFLRAGLEVFINAIKILPAELELKNSGDFRPGFEEYTDNGVEVKLFSGCHSTFETQSEDAETFDPKISGWYVICNNRIILAANKDEKTIWKGRHENFTYWHPQYNGFVGFIFFNSEDPKKLPWTTTKRFIDLESNLYRRALPKMMEMTKPWIRYTSQRKADLPKAKELEETANHSSLADLIIKPENKTSLFQNKVVPSFPVIQSRQADYYTNISFKIEKFRADKSKIELGNPSMTNADLGKHAFEYFYKNEIDQ